MNFFAICLEFFITHWVGTKRNDNLYFRLFLGHFQPIFAWKEAITVFFWFFEFFFKFFIDFLLRVGLERNGMIIFIFPIPRSIPTYYVMKWATMIFLNFPNFFSIFLEFSFMRRLITKRNDNFCFLSFSAFFNLFWL